MSQHRKIRQHRVLILESLERRLMLSAQAPLGEILGTAFHDLNGSGVKDVGESGLPGGTVYLDANNNGRFETGEPASVTNSNGDYRFSGLVAGAYTVREIAPAGHLPGFLRRPNVPAFSNDPGTLVAAKRDADNDLDLAVLVPNSNAVVLMTNDGTGTFTRVANAVFVDRNPLGIAAADLNGDNLVDLVTANSGSGTVSLLIGNGLGSFRVLPSLKVGAEPRAVTAFDYDRDGDTDLAVAYASDAGSLITLLRNDGADASGNPRFTAIALPKPSGPSYPTDIVAGDFNGDGRADLAVACLNSHEVVVYLNSSTGFSKDAVLRLTAIQSPAWLVAADLNGDGRLDLATANRDSNNVTVLLNLGGAGFQAAAFPAGQVPCDLAAADLDGDGDQDLVTVDRGSRSATMLLNDGRGAFARPIRVPAGDRPVAITAADLNGDGAPDLAAAAVNATTKDLSVWLNTQGLQRVTLASDQTIVSAVNFSNLEPTQSTRPLLTKVDTLTVGAVQDTAYTITYDQMKWAADEYDSDGDPLAFRVATVTSGTLTKNEKPVTPGTTLLGKNESLIWQPPAGDFGTLGAFTVSAWDGQLASATSVPVKVTVVGSAGMFRIKVLDGAAEGFNDPALGSLRRAAFKSALKDIWSPLLVPSYAGETITIDASMDPLGGSGSSVILGQSASTSLWSISAGNGTLVYTSALANHLNKGDLRSDSEITIALNSDLDNSTLYGAKDWYYGLDGNAGQKFDAVSVVAHEVGHGLGFCSRINADGTWAAGIPGIYDRFLVSGVGTAVTAMIAAARQAALTGGDLYWSGVRGAQSNSGANPKIYAPGTYTPGSSVSHVDGTVYPNAMMVPVYGKPQHQVSAIELGMLQDMGWDLAAAGTAAAAVAVGGSPAKPIGVAAFLQQRVFVQLQLLGGIERPSPAVCGLPPSTSTADMSVWPKADAPVRGNALASERVAREAAVRVRHDPQGGSTACRHPTPSAVAGRSTEQAAWRSTVDWLMESGQFDW